MAFEKAQEWEDRIPLGVIYRSERIIYEAQISAFKSGPLVQQGHDPLTMDDLLEEFIP
jgi:2-oxoglutarate ferredoxin oxidoreductase subunit beta